MASGWAIAPVGVTQPVASDQAHQWAEVGFEGLGWIVFEPTGPGGPSSRAGSKDIWEAELPRLTEILITDPLPNHRMDAAEELARFSGKAPLRAELVSEPRWPAPFGRTVMVRCDPPLRGPWARWMMSQ